ncbi:hypothetical protein [Vibrio penaeicida]|uniref:Uncharacterized protein n=1 Tax=Vibrio penaeicida TaxID=104609 RepID=A0AAV5NJ71_9VIBR|nr:hypothetical protein [Vibrio penaeicida]RTZ23428.1 hypothetical protein EKN09_08995 [Vibrio penaeicida]GLQ70687.1 hypothetical protein GCM10007932_00470 [Vibrio penaeicida]
MYTYKYLMTAVGLSSALLLSACDTGGSHTNSSDNASKSTTLNISISKAPVDGASCTLLDDESNVVGGPQLSVNGQLEIQLTTSGRFTVRCEGGEYLDESTGQRVDASSLVLRSVINVTAGQTVITAVTPLTEMAVQRAEKDNDLSDFDLQAKQVAESVGLTNIDITQVVPTDFNTQQSDGRSDADRYGLILAGLSQVTKGQGNGGSVQAITDLIKNYESRIEANPDSVKNELLNSLVVLSTSDSGAGSNIDSLTIETVQDNLSSSPSPAAKDSDGDGLSDEQEQTLGTNPNVADTDGDGVNDFDENRDGSNPLDSCSPNSSADDCDTDGDGLTNAQERALGTDPTKADTDGDNLSDFEENQNNTNPLDAFDPEGPCSPNPRSASCTGEADDDGDELSNAREATYNTNSALPDTDGDGLEDGIEVDYFNTNPLSADTDDDGASDGAEFDNGSDPNVADSDGDGLNDGQEITLGTKPRVADSDMDGLSDNAEVNTHGTDPLKPDTDGDELLDKFEIAELNTNPLLTDTDSDGLSDREEYDLGTNPLLADSDMDSVSDAQEVGDGTNPLVSDTDGDGLSDGAEKTTGSNPLKRDTDSDGLSDSAEITANTNPNDNDSDDDGLLDGNEVNTQNSNPNLVDSDGDGLRDDYELLYGLNINVNDANDDLDSDGLSNLAEKNNNSLPNDPDSDGDLLNDGDEIALGTSVLVKDSDGDGHTDGQEVSLGSNPLSTDSDGDGINDDQESRPLFDSDKDGLINIADIDSDNDGWLDADEIDALLDTDGDGFANMIDSDSDNDVIPDGKEIALGKNPLDSSDNNPIADSDGDGITDVNEFVNGTDPNKADTDDDGLSDKYELDNGFDPVNPADAALDADGDKLSNIQEFLLGTDLKDFDSDDDGLSDYIELIVFRLGNKDIPSGRGYTLNEEPNFGAFQVRHLDGDTLEFYETDSIFENLNFATLAAHWTYDTDPTNPGGGPTGPVGLPAFPSMSCIHYAPSEAYTLTTHNALIDDVDRDGLKDGEENNFGIDQGFLEASASASALLFSQELFGDPYPGDAIFAIYETNDPDDADGYDIVIFDNSGADYSLRIGQLASPSRQYIIDRKAAGEVPIFVAWDGNADGIPNIFQTIDRKDCLSQKVVEDLGLDAYQHADFDGDNLSDAYEILVLGSNPKSNDTDNDGVSDNREAMPDFIVVGGANDPLNFISSFDTVRSCHSNLFEADTDGDGLSDGIECDNGMSTTSNDSDGDGLLDNQEVRICGRDEAGCREGDLVRMSNPVGTDTDADGIPDGKDLHILNPDFDLDGILDGKELTVGYNVSTQHFSSSAGSDFIPSTFTMGIPDNAIAYRILVELEPTVINQDVDAFLAGLPGEITNHSVHPYGTQFIANNVIETVSGQTSIDVDLSGNHIRVLNVYLIGYSELDVIPAIPTLATRKDSDLDGIVDNQESLETLWLSAEHYNSESATVTSNRNALNGQAIQIQGATAGDPILTITSSDHFISGLKATNYALYIRASEDNLGVSQSIDVDLRYSGVLDSSTSITDLSLHYDWKYVGSVDATSEFEIDVKTNMTGDSPFIDEIAFVPQSFTPSTITLENYDNFEETRRIPNVTGTVQLHRDLPWGLSAPMQADTDGDGYRTNAGILAGSVGWLTDGFERQLGLNSFDIDSDLDYRLEDPDRFESVTVSGNSLIVVGTPDGVADFTDSNDPSPTPLDSDADGIDDAVEQASQLLRLRNACIAASAAPDIDCPESNFDDLSDLSTYCTDALDGSGALPLCDYVDDDRDDDGIPDGLEDRNGNGLVEANESDPNKLDTDNDCISDGVELGLSCPIGQHTLMPVGAETCDGNTYTNVTVGGKPEATTGYGGFTPDADSNTTSNPALVDTDGDGISDGNGSDGLGLHVGGNYFGEDNNCNGRVDIGESDPSLKDTDGDGYPDNSERIAGTNPQNTDSDGDGLSDYDEINQFNTDPLVADTDGDGLIDGAEVNRAGGATNPRNADTDGDGINDEEEILGTSSRYQCGTDFHQICGDEGNCIPRAICGSGSSTGAFLCNFDAYCAQQTAMTEAQCLSSYATCQVSPTDPLQKDSDADGLPDLRELTLSKTNPNNLDTDGDGLSDHVEYYTLPPLRKSWLADPRQYDTDKDSVNDGVEVGQGSNPNNVSDVPSIVYIGTYGLVFDLRQFTLNDGVFVRTGSEIPLTCFNLPSPPTYIDGEIRIRSTEQGYVMNVVGDMYLSGYGKPKLWTQVNSGATSFDENYQTASVAIEDFSVPGMELDLSDGSKLRFGRLTSIDVCSPVLTQPSGTLVLPAPVSGNGASVAQYTLSDIKLSTATEEFKVLRLRQEIPVPAGTPSEQASLYHVDYVGDLTFNPELGSLMGNGTILMPLLSDEPILPYNSPIAFEDITTSVPKVDLTVGDSFTIEFGKFSDGGLLSNLNIDLSKGGKCRIEGDFSDPTFICKIKRTKQGAYELEGEISVNPAGRLQFVGNWANNPDRSWRDLVFDHQPIASQIPNSDNGQLDFTGTLTVPVTNLPLEWRLDGQMLSDISTRDGDPLFTGMNGTLNLNIRKAAEIEEAINSPVQLGLEVGQAGVAMIYSGATPQFMSFYTEQGIKMRGVPVVESLFDLAVRAGATCDCVNNGLIDLTNGIVQGNNQIALMPGQFGELSYTLTPPIKVSPNTGRFNYIDGTAGGMELEGRYVFRFYELEPIETTIEGDIGFDGEFLFSGTATAGFGIPSLANLHFGSSTVTVTDKDFKAEGNINIPGLGDMTGRIEIDRPSLGVYSPTEFSFPRARFSATGNVSIGGYTFSEVTASAQAYLPNRGGSIFPSQGLHLSGKMQLPIGAGGSLVSVEMSGIYKSPTDWEFTATNKALNVLGFAANGNVTLSSSTGLVMVTEFSVPLFPEFRWVIHAQPNGAMSATGQRVGNGALGNNSPIALGSGIMTIYKSSGADIPDIQFKGNLIVKIPGTSYRMDAADVTLNIALDGSFAFRTDFDIFGQTMGVDTSFGRSGTSMNGSVSLGNFGPFYATMKMSFNTLGQFRLIADTTLGAVHIGTNGCFGVRVGVWKLKKTVTVCI